MSRDMSGLTLVEPAGDDEPTATTTSGKPVAPVEVEVVWPEALGEPKVALYVDPATAVQLAHAWSLWNSTHPGAPGRERWVDDVVDLHRSAIEIETYTGDLTSTAAVPFPVEIVRSLVAEERLRVDLGTDHVDSPADGSDS